MLTALMSANAQTRVATMQGDEIYAIPGDYTLSRTPQLCIKTEEGFDVYDANLQRLRSIAIDTERVDFGFYGIQNRQSSQTEWQWGNRYSAVFEKTAYDSHYDDVDATGLITRGLLSDNWNPVVVTQTLFNRDEDYEYIMPGSIAGFFDTNEFVYSREINFYVHITSYEVRNSQGEVLYTLACDEGWYSESRRVDLIKIGGNFYLSFEETDGENYQTVFFRLDREQASITRVEEALPMLVRPTMTMRGEQITVELGENASATEIEVLNAMGQSVKRVPVQVGQREVKFSVENSGLHLINARRGNRQGTIKIIVR